MKNHGRSWVVTSALALASALSAGTLAAQSPDPALVPGADWLPTVQFPSGAYPWSLGGPVEPDSQGATARGMLVAYRATGDPRYLDSAIATGNFLVDSYPRRFANGDVDMFPLDPLFLEELSWTTGDPRYASFVQEQLWNRLTAGSYGANRNQNATTWAANMPVFEEYASWIALRPYYRAYAAVAAHYAGELATRDAIMRDLVLRLEAITTSRRTTDLTGLASSIWASAHTGMNLDPRAGRWASSNTTQSLVNVLVGYQRAAGDWPYDTSSGAAAHVGDVSVTSWAVMALGAFDRAVHADRIARGLQFVRAQQQLDGQILTNPGYPPETETGVQIHAEALVALGTLRGTPFEDLEPVNLDPVAVDDTATTERDVSVSVAVLTNDSDPDGSLVPASVSVVSGPLNGSATVTPATGAIAYTPATGYVGPDSFSYRVSDDDGAPSNVATVSVQVTAPPPPPPPPPPTWVFNPSADTYVAQATPTTNFGSASTLYVRQKTASVEIPFFKFQVAGVSGSVARARLRIYVSAGSGEATTLYRANDNYVGSATPWTESGLNWSNADLAGASIGTFALRSGQWAELDVTSQVSGDGTYSFAIFNAPSLRGSVRARESVTAPELVVETQP